MFMENVNVGLIVFWLFVIIGFIVFLSNWIVITKQQTVKIIQRMGKFHLVANAGVYFKTPFIDNVAGSLSLAIIKHDVKVDTKTLDNVMVRLHIDIQTKVEDSKIFEAFYKLKNPIEQLYSYVYEVVVSQVPKLKLDDVFLKTGDISIEVKNKITQTMKSFGIEVINALVVGIVIDGEVSKAMNAINASERMKEANRNKGEADKILVIKQAEAEAESKFLQGQGIAKQRKAIIDGLKESVADFKQAIPGCSEQDVINLVTITQYFDTLNHVGSKSKAILIPYSAGGMKNISDEIRNSLITANEIGN
jgi:regulator of protease activity HflC (stomatin/prohibitin superfamily)